MNQITIGNIVWGDREVFPPYLYEAYQSTRRRDPMLPLIGSQALNACSLCELNLFSQYPWVIACCISFSTSCENDRQQRS